MTEYTLGDAAIRQIQELVRRELRRPRNYNNYPRRGRWQGASVVGGGSGSGTIREGYLISDLDPASNCGANPTTAIAIAYTVSGGVWTPGGSFVVTNRFDNTGIQAGSHVVTGEVNGENRPIAWDFANCDPQVAQGCDCIEDQTGYWSVCRMKGLDLPNYGGAFPPSALAWEFCPGTCTWAAPWSNAIPVTIPGHGATVVDAHLRYEAFLRAAAGELVVNLMGEYVDPITGTEVFIVKTWSGVSWDTNKGNPGPVAGQTVTLQPVRANVGQANPDSNFVWWNRNYNNSCTATPSTGTKTPFEVASLEGHGCAGTFDLRWNQAGNNWIVENSSCAPPGTANGNDCCPEPRPNTTGTALGVGDGYTETRNCLPGLANFAAITLQITCVDQTLCGDNPPCDYVKP